MESRWEPGGLYRIGYRDADGAVTERTIRITTTARGRFGAVYISAFCFFRNSERTFRQDRMTHCEPVGEPADTPALPTMKTKIKASEPPAPVNPSAARAGAGQKNRPAGGFYFIPVLMTCVCLILLVRHPELFAGRAEPLRPPIDISESFISLNEKDPNGTKGASVSRKIVLSSMAFRNMTVVAVRTDAGDRFRVAEFGLEYGSRAEAFAAINADLYARAGGTRDARLLGLFAGADRDGNGALSWEELERFQTGLCGAFRYQANDTALRPEEFLAAGGGDCEDWALLTCALAAFYNVDAVVGMLSSPDNGERHAICLIHQETKPDWAVSYYFASSGTCGGGEVKAGHYIPVDYQEVGALSNAAGGDWKLTALYLPESMYDRAF